ncbi:MAG: ABC transporter ATP-binding protein [Chthoniobacteraceae bacterium]
MVSLLIALENLRKTFDGTVAVDDISMSIPAGEIFGFLGANGAGKTTTIRMLCGLTRPSGGRATLGGADVWRDRFRVRSMFGYVAQRFSLYTDLTVKENLRFFGGAYRVNPRRMEARIAELLSTLDLSGKSHMLAGELSGGLRQLLAIGCALIHEPLALFLDEPTSGLDPVHRQRIWDLLYDLSAGGTTIFVTTHYMDEAERCTEVAFIDKGRLLAKDSPLRLKQRIRGRLLQLRVAPLMPALALIRAEPDVLGVSVRSGMVRLYAAHPEALFQRWLEHWPFPEIEYQGHTWDAPDMEDVFKAYSQGYHGILAEEAQP